MEKKMSLEADLADMMYGFGDSWPPDPESVKFMELLVKNYMQDLVVRAVLVSQISGKFDHGCFQFVVRKDRKKFNRVQKLMKTKEEVDKLKDNFGKEFNEQ